MSKHTILDAHRCVPHLIKAAKEGRLMTYGELAGLIDRHWRPARLWLGYIRDDLCLPNGFPMLTAIVIRQVGTPGKSFLPGGTQDPETSFAYAQKAKLAQDDVFAFSNWDRLQTVADQVRSGIS